MDSRPLLSSIILLISLPLFQVDARDDSVEQRIVLDSSPFSIALENLQKQINYKFQSISLLRRAMTHPSFSEESNRVLSILGEKAIETSASLRYLQKNMDITPKELNLRLLQISNVESSCAVDGTRLGLHKVVRVAPKTDSTSPQVVCGAFRAIFGAIALDTGKPDDAGPVFWGVHGGSSSSAGIAVETL